VEDVFLVDELPDIPELPVVAEFTVAPELPAD